MGDLSQLAQQKADELRHVGRGEDALLVLEHAIQRLPNDLAILGAYADLARTLIDERGLDEPDARLEALEAFVRGRAIHVQFENIDDVLRVAVNARRTSNGGRPDGAPRQQVADPGDVLHDVRVGKLDPTAPDEQVVLAARIRDLEDARTALEDAGPAAVELRAVDEALAAARLARDFDAAAAEARALLDGAKTVSNSARGVYVLQQVEAVLRPFVLDAERLTRLRLERADQLLGELCEASDAAAQRTRDADAEARWQAFKGTHRDHVNELRSWNPPGTLFVDGACNAVLERARPSPEPHRRRSQVRSLEARRDVRRASDERRVDPAPAREHRARLRPRRRRPPRPRGCRRRGDGRLGRGGVGREEASRGRAATSRPGPDQPRSRASRLGEGVTGSRISSTISNRPHPGSRCLPSSPF